MAFGFAGAAAGGADALVEELAQRRLAFMQQEQLKLQQEAATRQAEEFTMAKADRETDKKNRRAQIALTALRPGALSEAQAAPLQGTDYAGLLDNQQTLPSTSQAGDLASGTMAQTQDAGGQGFSILRPTMAQEEVAGQKQKLRVIGDLFKRGAPRNEVAGAFADAGENVPAALMGEDPTVTDARRQRSAIELEKIRAANEMQQIAAQGAESRRTNAANPTKGAQTVADGEEYTTLSSQRTIAAIDDVLPQINMLTAGVVGNALGKIGYQPARNVDAKLQAVVSNIAFKALQDMRNASKTGGALGQVSEKELALLSSVEGSIRQDQSPANLIKQLKTIRESMQRVQMAGSVGGPAASHGTAPEYDFIDGQLVPRAR